jgi:broad specificity phosphatase PhoE
VILHLLRHGQTQQNLDSVGLGRFDAPLTEKGLAQVRALGERLAERPIDRVLASPLSRALSTADAVALPHALTVEVRDELIELDIGETEGMKFSAVRERWPEFADAWLGPRVVDAVMPGGESLRQLAGRLGPVIELLRACAAEEVVAVATHNFVIKTLLCELLGVDLSNFRSFEVGLASLSTLSLRGKRTTVVALNDTCHLESLEP